MSGVSSLTSSPSLSGVQSTGANGAVNKGHSKGSYSKGAHGKGGRAKGAYSKGAHGKGSYSKGSQSSGAAGAAHSLQGSVPTAPVQETVASIQPASQPAVIQTSAAPSVSEDQTHATPLSAAPSPQTSTNPASSGQGGGTQSQVIPGGVVATGEVNVSKDQPSTSTTAPAPAPVASHIVATGEVNVIKDQSSTSAPAPAPAPSASHVVATGEVNVSKDQSATSTPAAEIGGSASIPDGQPVAGGATVNASPSNCKTVSVEIGIHWVCPQTNTTWALVGVQILLGGDISCMWSAAGSGNGFPMGTTAIGCDASQPHWNDNISIPSQGTSSACGCSEPAYHPVSVTLGKTWCNEQTHTTWTLVAARFDQDGTPQFDWKVTTQGEGYPLGTVATSTDATSPHWDDQVVRPASSGNTPSQGQELTIDSEGLLSQPVQMGDTVTDPSTTVQWKLTGIDGPNDGQPGLTTYTWNVVNSGTSTLPVGTSTTTSDSLTPPRAKLSVDSEGLLSRIPQIGDTVVPDQSSGAKWQLTGIDNAANSGSGSKTFTWTLVDPGASGLAVNSTTTTRAPLTPPNAYWAVSPEAANREAQAA